MLCLIQRALSRFVPVCKDLRSANVLLSASHRAKIADLGLAKHQDRSALPSLSVLFNQHAAFPPESVAWVDGPDGLKRSAKWDIWQFGTICVEVLVQELWSNQSAYDANVYAMKLARLRQDVLLPKGVSADLAELTLRCLQWSPEDRPAASELYPVLCDL